MNSVNKQRRACQCGEDPQLPAVCVRARSWYALTSKRNITQDYPKMKQTFKNLAEFELDNNSEAQIERDLYRTFPRHPFFL